MDEVIGMWALACYYVSLVHITSLLIWCEICTSNVLVMCNIPKIYRHFNNFMYTVISSISISKFKHVNNIVASINITIYRHIIEISKVT